jgi:hypothetical protein
MPKLFKIKARAVIAEIEVPARDGSGAPRKVPVIAPSAATYERVITMSREVSDAVSADGAGAKFAKPVDMILLLAPGLERADVEECMAAEDLPELIVFLMEQIEARAKAREEEGLGNPFSEKPSPSGGSSGSPSPSSAASSPATSAT